MNERVNPLASIKRAEFELSKEILVPNFDILIISGDSGTGKSTLGRGLAKLLGINTADIGDKIRKKTEEQLGETPVDFAARDVSVDTEFDKKTAEIVRNATSGKPFVLVARMGPWVAKKEEVKARQNGEVFPRVVTINLTANKETKIERIRIREHAKHPEMTDEEIDQKTFLDNIKNQENWHLAHPDLEENPLDPQATYQGEYIFNLTVTTDNLNKEEVLLKTIRLLKENNSLLI